LIFISFLEPYRTGNQTKQNQGIPEVPGKEIQARLQGNSKIGGQRGEQTF
jgi:hypothetical protein